MSTDILMTDTKIKTERTFPSVPFEALWDFAKDVAGGPSPAALGFTAIEFADMVGHNVKAVNRWQTSGRVPWKSADKAATRLGHNPIEIWNLDWLNVMGDFDDIASGVYDDEINADLDRVFGPAAIKKPEPEPTNSGHLDRDGRWTLDPKIPLTMTDVYVLEGILKEKGLLEGDPVD